MIVATKGRFLFFLLFLISLFSLSLVLAQDLKTITNTDELIAAASEGGSYKLAVGRYELDETLLIERDFSLFGAGMDSTQIITKAELIGVSVQGEIAVAFDSITFKHEGDLQEDVVEIKDAQFSIRFCKFTGGVFQEAAEDAEYIYGGGLWLHGNASGEIYDSVFTDNDLDGINTSDTVELRLERSVLSNNVWTGIRILDQSKVFIDDVLIENNSGEGISISGTSYLNLSNSIVQRNVGGGVWLFEEVKANIIDNQIHQNKTYSGIGANGSTNVRISRNEITGHDESAGIYIYETASGSVSDNAIFDNETGISVADEAQLQVIENSFSANNEGVNVFDNASVTIANNSFTNLIEEGINLFDTSYASIKENEMYGQGLTGDELETFALIASYDEASSYIAENEFDYTDVSVAHVYLGDMSQSTILDNSFSGNNLNPAIDVNGEARATIRDNVIDLNAYGIIVRSTGVATVSSNIFEDNGYAILAYGEAKVIATENIMDYGTNSAVALREDSQIWLRENSIQFAGDAAIDARGSSRAGLFNNDLSYSESFGIYSVDKSVVYANKNYVGANNNSGVYAADNSSVAIMDNVFEDHFDYGVELAGQSSGTSAYNYFSNNYIGLGFGQDAEVSIVENEFVDNNTDVSRIK